MTTMTPPTEIAYWEAPELQSTLDKQGDRIKTWRSRYFIFKEGTLFYFKDTAVTKTTKPSGKWALVDCVSVAAIENKAEQFKILLSTGAEVRLQAENQRMRDKWVQLLEPLPAAELSEEGAAASGIAASLVKVAPLPPGGGALPALPSPHAKPVGGVSEMSPDALVDKLPSLLRMLPVGTVNAIVERMPRAALRQLIDRLSPPKVGTLVGKLSEKAFASLIEKLEPDDVCAVVLKMRPDDLTVALKKLPPASVPTLVGKLSEAIVVLLVSEKLTGPTLLWLLTGSLLSPEALYVLVCKMPSATRARLRERLGGWPRETESMAKRLAGLDAPDAAALAREFCPSLVEAPAGGGEQGEGTGGSAAVPVH